MSWDGHVGHVWMSWDGHVRHVSLLGGIEDCVLDG